MPNNIYNALGLFHALNLSRIPSGERSPMMVCCDSLGTPAMVKACSIVHQGTLGCGVLRGYVNARKALSRSEKSGSG